MKGLVGYYSKNEGCSNFPWYILILKWCTRGLSEKKSLNKHSLSGPPDNDWNILPRLSYWDVLLVLRINGLFHPYKGRFLDTSRIRRWNNPTYDLRSLVTITSTDTLVAPWLPRTTQQLLDVWRFLPIIGCMAGPLGKTSPQPKAVKLLVGY